MLFHEWIAETSNCFISFIIWLFTNLLVSFSICARFSLRPYTLGVNIFDNNQI